MMTVQELMSTRTVAVDYDSPLVDAARLMRDRGVSAVAVTQAGPVVGMLTDRDFTIKLAAEGIDPSSVSVGDIASEDAVTAERDERLDTVFRRMSYYGVGRLPVVDDDGRLVGMVSRADLARAVD
jgi:CBS domain-containing protein